MEYISEIIVGVITFLLGLFSCKIWVNFKSKKQDTHTTQSDNIVGGDQAGRDIKKK